MSEPKFPSSMVADALPIFPASWAPAELIDEDDAADDPDPTSAAVLSSPDIFET